jgi:hypothetical protein
MSGKSEAAWLAEYRASGSIYTQQECGCLAFVMVDMPSEVRAARKEIAEQVAKGREVHRCDRDSLPPLNCAEHAR